MKNIAIFASGSGTNAQNIIEYFKEDKQVCIKIVLSNKIDAKVHERAKKFGIPSFTFDRNDFYESEKVLDLLKENRIDLIVLAGFLWLVPDNLIKFFPRKIINIHPALLPKYGGKGMYGDKVHQAVIDNLDTESGITIHYVDERYDEGPILFQAKCEVKPNDTPDTLATRIHALEYEHYPKVIEKILNK